MHFAFYHSKTTLKTCILLITRRAFSIQSNNLKIASQMKWNTIESFHLSGRITECKKFNHLTTSIRFLASGQKGLKRRVVNKELDNLKEEEEEVVEEEEEEEEKPVKKLKAKSKKNKQIEIPMIDSSYLNDELQQTNKNEALFMKISNGDTDKLNELNDLNEKINLLTSMYGITLNMNEEKWMELLKNSKHMRIRYLSYLISKCIKSHYQTKNKCDISEYHDIINSDNAILDDPMCYHLFHNSMFIKFRYKSIRKRLYARSMAAMLYAPEIFIDCSYDSYMTNMESKYLGKQIIDSIRQNLLDDNPYNIILCNFNKNDSLGKSISTFSPLFYSDNYPIVTTSKSYLDYYPKEKFVYLTPHCNQMLNEINPNKRYIIGGYVDKINSQRVSLAKAKENGIEMAKFPLDRYLVWKQGKKSLCVNHVFGIMLKLKNNNNDWREALDEIIPSRHYTDNDKGQRTKPTSNIYNNVKRVLYFGGTDLEYPEFDFDENRVD